jgi:hypothetical protein
MIALPRVLKFTTDGCAVRLNVKAQMGHKSIQITGDTYPSHAGGDPAAVDRLGR